MTITGTNSDDNLIGTTGDDTFDMSQGGNDTVAGLGGNDGFLFGAAYTAADIIDGGDGNDALILNGDYSTEQALANLTSIETVRLGSGHSYAFDLALGMLGAGQALVIDGSSLGSGDTLLVAGQQNSGTTLTVLGGAGNDQLFGGDENNQFTGGDGDDFVFAGGGNDTLDLGTGDDVVNIFGNFSADDAIDGGTGIDTVNITGDYSAGLTLTAAMLVNVESVYFGDSGHNYNITTVDQTVAAGSKTNFVGASIGSHSLIFDGSAETDGAFGIYASSGNDNLTGGAGGDSFDSGQGNDIINGGAGDDSMTSNVGALNAADKFDGGTGSDTIYFYGVSPGPVVLAPKTIVNFETFFFSADANYNIKTNDTTVAENQNLLVQAQALLATSVLVFDGSLETNGTFHILSGAGNDTLTGGKGSDTINGGDGNDSLASGGDGNDMIDAGNGDDAIGFGLDLDALDLVNGGTGYDTLSLKGAYTLTLDGGFLQNIEALTLNDGFTYTLVEHDNLVGAGQTFRIDAHALGGTRNFNFDGSAELDGSFSILGGSGNDTIAGGANDDSFTPGKRNDVVHGGGGNDTFVFNTGELTAADTIDGGTGFDTVRLSGSYGHAVHLTATTLTNMEKMLFAPAGSYNIISHDATVGAGLTLTVDGSALLSTDALTFNGAAETDGSFTMTGGAGKDTLTGGAGNDTLTGNDGADTLDGGAGADTLDGGAGDDHITAGSGADSVVAGAGNDTITLGANLDTADSIDGGSGNDTVILNGDYAAGFTFNAANLQSVETLILQTGHGYTLATIDANVAAGQRLTVNGSALSASNVLSFDGTAEADGKFTLTGGGAADLLVGGAGSDILNGGAGNDTLKGGAGNDTISGGAGGDTILTGTGHDVLSYAAVSETNGTPCDLLMDFDAANDKFDLPVAVSGIDAMVTTGALSAASFKADLKIDLGAAKLASGHAVLFTASTGDLAGHTYLVVDANGTAGYQPSLDYVIEIAGTSNLSALSTADFI